jgi:aspartate aminotransferase-like enzyme
MLPLVFKEAVDQNELEQIHALNHRIFAEEIAQHKPQSSGLLIDRFHAQNRYFIAVRNAVVIGMISAHSGPEFSVRRRLLDPSMLTELPKPLEIRLLAIEPKERNRTVLSGLLWQVYDFAVSNDFSHLLISAISWREDMYRRLGFRPLGPAVPDGSASFIPMVMAIGPRNGAQRARVRLHERHWRRRTGLATRNASPATDAAEPVSLLPGPVAIHPRITRAFASPPVSHRSAAFTEGYERVRSHLSAFLPGMEVVLFAGAGTLANDAVAANLRAIFEDAKGLVLSNGEFGERLAKQATSAGLQFEHLAFPYGSAWSFDAIRATMEHEPRWIWAVHLETSTGVLNDVKTLLSIARTGGCAVALDCVSSLGAVPLLGDRDVLLLASGVSGKSLGAYAGLAFVYLSDACHSRLSSTRLCPSFDLLRMQQSRGPVSTVASSTLRALACALEQGYASADAMARRFEEYRLLGERVRRELRALGIQPLAPDGIAAPQITTFDLPYPSFPEKCLQAGYAIAHESRYLQSRKWGQIATMGDIKQATLDAFFQAVGSTLETCGA